MLDRLAEGLDGTAKLTHALLSQLRESEADFATIKTELSVLQETVKSLSMIVREGNGAMSLITKIALIEQKNVTTDNWLENHLDVHHHIKGDLTALDKAIENLESKLSKLEAVVYTYSRKIDEAERVIKFKEQEEREAIRRSISREDELQFEKKKSEQKIAEEWNGFYVKIVTAVLLAILASTGTWITANYMNAKAPAPLIEK
jgi:septal ring factor EnvC (AmiA/AmiB activator)